MLVVTVLGRWARSCFGHDAGFGVSNRLNCDPEKVGCPYPPLGGAVLGYLVDGHDQNPGYTAYNTNRQDVPREHELAWIIHEATSSEQAPEGLPGMTARQAQPYLIGQLGDAPTDLQQREAQRVQLHARTAELGQPAAQGIE